MDERSDRLKKYARRMRGDPTLGEAILWRHLRRSNLGVRFRHQHPVGPYIADFACYSPFRMVVEVDGATHKTREQDVDRDRWFLDNGWFVLRVWDTDIIRDVDQVLDVIEQAVRDPESVFDPLNEIDPLP